jgi:hypothetical protein
MAKLYVNDVKFIRVYPMKKKSVAAFTLQELIQGIGIPAGLHCDGAQELQHGKWKEICSDHGIRQMVMEPYLPWQNCAEMNIRELKKAVSRMMHTTGAPPELWDYCVTYVTELTCFISNDNYALHGKTPNEIITKNTPLPLYTFLIP